MQFEVHNPVSGQIFECRLGFVPVLTWDNTTKITLDRAVWHQGDQYVVYCTYVNQCMLNY